MNDLTGALLAPRSTAQEVSGYSCPLLEPRCRRPVDITESCSSPKLLRRSTTIMSRRVLPRMLTRGMSLFATIAEFRGMRFVPLILLVSTFVYQVAESHRVIFFRPSASATTVFFSVNVFVVLFSETFKFITLKQYFAFVAGQWCHTTRATAIIVDCRLVARRSDNSLMLRRGRFLTGSANSLRNQVPYSIPAHKRFRYWYLYPRSLRS